MFFGGEKRHPRVRLKGHTYHPYIYNIYPILHYPPLILSRSPINHQLLCVASLNIIIIIIIIIIIYIIIIIIIIMLLLVLLFLLLLLLLLFDFFCKVYHQITETCIESLQNSIDGILFIETGDRSNANP